VGANIRWKGEQVLGLYSKFGYFMIWSIGHGDGIDLGVLRREDS